MKVSYFHVANDVPSAHYLDTAVVIDVLRATTTIAYALTNGASSVEVFADISNLMSKADLWPVDSRLLLGERGGRKIDGFNLGNSPVGVTSEVVAGKRIFMSTTNGTRSLSRVSQANNLFTMSLPNRQAIAEKLLNLNPESLTILGSGWEGSYSLEDSFAAGALISYLLDKAPSSVDLINDESLASLALWDRWQSEPETCLRSATHGKRLINLGDHDLDFECCSSLDELSVIPTQLEAGVLYSK